MHDTIVTGKISECNQPNILSQFSVGCDDLFPRAVVEQAQITSGDGVSRLFEEINEMSPNIAAMASDKNFHNLLLANPET
jgi:hypothetical protein